MPQRQVNGARRLSVYPRPMNVRPMDPRAIDTEVGDPTYCVVFWSTVHAGPPGEEHVFATEHLVTESADVDEVIAWARGEAGETREFAVYIILDRTRIRLMGHGP